MVIGIDVTQMAYPGSGVANYTYNLVKNLLLLDKKNIYKLFYSSFRKTQETKEKLNEFKRLGARVFIFPFPPRTFHFLWMKHHLLPVEWLIGKVDFFHSSDFLRPPLLRGTKGITTIHDLTWKIYPQFHTQDIIKAHERKLKKTIEYKDVIIVDSENTKKDLLRYYPQIKNNNKLYVIYPGIGESFRPIKDKEKIRKVLKKYNLNYPANYLLYVGAIEPRKNLDTAIKVFSKLLKNGTTKPKPSRLSRDNIEEETKTMYQNNKHLIAKKIAEPRRLSYDSGWQDYKFLIVGRAGWKNEKIFKLVKDLGLEKKVVFVGFVEDRDLPYFYNAAKILIYLSKYEGFGLPPLEALACGTSVLAGDNSSLREILPKEYLVNLNNKNLILKKLTLLLKTNKPVKIKRQFSWKNYVNKFLKIINEF